MKYLALYRKYRPKAFEDVYGQDAIVKTIKSALKNDKISHAYLFSGPRGTGKTTIAKLIGHIVNCENYPTDVPCGKCSICKRNANGEDVDIIEIDAASNNGVDEIREIRNKVSLVPTFSRYKVYVIDEVHMLTTGAFNALLKTLEEPPAHVIFILATTEPYKIPNTIISRCQRFDFKKISEENIVKGLQSILKREKIDVEEQVLMEVANLSDGGMRDAISLLDQLLAFGDKKLTIEDIHLINGTLTNEELGDFLLSIYEKKIDTMIKKINEYNDNGKDFVKITDEFVLFIRNLLLVKMNCEENERFSEDLINVDIAFLYKCIDSLLEVKNNFRNSNYEKLLFELALLKLISVPEQVVVEEQIEIKTKEEPKKKDEKEKEEISHVDGDKFEEFKSVRINNVFATADKEKLKKIKDNWKSISEFSLDKKLGVCAGMLLDGNVMAASEDFCLISYPYESMAIRFNKNIDKIERLIKKVFDLDINVISVCDDEWNTLKKEYIKRVKNKENYEIKKETIKFKDLIVEIEKNNIAKEAKDALDIFGEDLVEIE